MIKEKCHNIIDEADKIHKIKTSISVVQNLDLTCNCNRTWTSHERFVNMTLYFFPFDSISIVGGNPQESVSWPRLFKCILLPAFPRQKFMSYQASTFPQGASHIFLSLERTQQKATYHGKGNKKKLLFHNEYRSISARINYNSRRYPVATENHAATEHNQHDLQQLQGTSH